MKCRPGDLAVVIRSEAGNVGKVRTCLRLATFTDFAEEGVPETGPGPYWVMDQDLDAVFQLTYVDGSTQTFLAKTRLYPDLNLRPLRDPGDDAIDEMLLLVGSPEGATA